MATKTGGNPTVNVRLTPEMIEALDRIVEVGEYNDRSDVIREWSLVLIEAVLVANSSKKAWKGAWEILKGLNRVNERFAKIAKKAQENAQQDLLKEQDPAYLEPLERCLARQAMREELARV
jgi:Arc/MetJ-type ribon-helix-helix transcriptional regulator